MATHSNTLAWRISWTEEPAGYSPLGCKEWDMTVAAEHAHISIYGYTFSLYIISILFLIFLQHCNHIIGNTFGFYQNVFIWDILTVPVLWTKERRLTGTLEYRSIIQKHSDNLEKCSETSRIGSSECSPTHHRRKINEQHRYENRGLIVANKLIMNQKCEPGEDGGFMKSYCTLVSS